MKKPESLDELVSRKAVEFADQIKAAASMADKEEEIRIEVERQLAFIEVEAGIKLEGRHEFTVASGRVDSVYARVIIEYKNPSSAGARIGPKADSPGSKKVVEQIKSRFYDMRLEYGRHLNTLFGVGLDGNYFIFVRFRDEKWDVQEPVEVNRYSAERFLWALFNLGYKGKAFSPEYLALDFGSAAESSVATGGIRALYNAIVDTDHPKAQTFFSQWKILFGEVCGYDVDNPSDKIKKLAEFYGVPLKGIKPAEMLFAVHTYYALFMKLLASEIVAFFHKLPTPLHNMIRAGSSNKLKHQMEDLELGSIFRHLNITNFLEGDLFAWYTSVWSDPIEKLVRDMVARLDNYNPGTLSEDPASSRDLLKRLYQQLFPKSVRHDLGEYYTPDWLAEHVLNEVGYVGDPDKRLLDPACGSGTFLVVAISRIRAWFNENRERCRYDEGDLCRKMLSNVIGFDLNPLAVMARTNYLISIRDLIGHVDKIEIPVYLCDSIMTPSEYGGLFFGRLGKTRKLKMAPATFIVPTEIAGSRDDIAKYAEQLEYGVRHNTSADDFIDRCRDEGLTVTDDQLHAELFNELLRLDQEKKNGVWARIIKNSFAPLFTDPVDFVIGNPPWVFWNNLPSEYREQARTLMADTYGIIAKRASTMRRLGQAGKDLSMLFFYVSLDVYLKPMVGKLGFVITQTLCQTTAATEFRQFKLPNGTPVNMSCVDDWVSVDPFVSAANKTAVFYAHAGETTSYPVSYRKWKAERPFNRDSARLAEIYESCVCEEFQAVPSSSDRRSFWILTKGETAEPTVDSTSSANYKVRLGVETKLESAFRVRVLQESSPKNTLLVENNRDRAKKQVPKLSGRVEKELVYPFIGGLSINRWKIEPEGYYLVPHLPHSGMEAIPESEMRKSYKYAYEFFSSFREELTDRSLYKRWGKGKPFYSMFDIGTYTFNPYRVAWKRTTKNFAAAIMSYVDDEWLGRKLLIPNGNVMFIPCGSEEAAHFVCALLNSSPARLRINRSITTKVHAEMINLVQLPRYDPKDSSHQRLSGLSIRAHKLAAEGSLEALASKESEVDQEAATLWTISGSELESIRAAVAGFEGRRKRERALP